MLAIDASAADRPDLHDTYFDGSLELLRELTVTNDVDAALPRLSAIVSKMLPHDALRMTCFDQRGRPVVNASTADVPDIMTSEGAEVIIDDLHTGGLAHPRPRTRRSGWSAPATARSWACRRARRSPWCAWRSGRSGRWRSIARTWRSRVGSRTTLASEHPTAKSPEPPMNR